MARKLERLIEIDHLIRTKSRMTANQLAQAVGYSERTIQSDLAFLRDRFHAPLEYTPKKGLHYVDDDWRLPSISLTKGELFALTLGARILESASGSAYIADLRSAIARLSERLPEEMWVDLQQIATEKIMFSGVGVELSADIWQDLETACREQRTVLMTYYTASRDAQGDRELDPYLLHIYRGTNPYVIGFCHKRQAIRWFRVDRIQALEVLEKPFERDPTFDPKAHLSQIFQAEVGHDPIDIAIWFDSATAPYVRERQWHPSQTLEEHSNGSLTLKMTVPGLNEVKRWILGYGRGAKVLAPQELITMVQQDLAGMVRHYNEAEINDDAT